MVIEQNIFDMVRSSHKNGRNNPQIIDKMGTIPTKGREGREGMEVHKGMCTRGYERKNRRQT